MSITIGDARLGPDDPHHLDAGELGQHQVEQDEVWALPPELRQGLAAVGGGNDPESVRLERFDQRLAQRRFVFDDQDRSCHPPLRIAARVNELFARRSLDPNRRSAGCFQAARGAP